MPTPVQHLVIANTILEHPDLPDRIRALLNEHRAAFMLGNTAPDVQTISGQTREATHFFDVPFSSNQPAHEALFELYPHLQHTSRLSPDHAAFMTGYISHLLLDVLWVRDIFLPAFGPDATWSNFRERLFFHNVLRAWCDRQDQARLIAETGAHLAEAQPEQWLPFTADRYLESWRDLLATQLAPGGVVRTVEVFAERGKVSPQHFERILSSPQNMEDLIFCHIPLSGVEAFNQSGLVETLALIQTYLNGVEA